MALTQNQKDAIKRAMKQNIAKRAAMQRTKISDSEARKASSTMNKRPDKAPAFVNKDRRLLTKSELEALARSSKANADKEKKMQKQRKFAKGEGKLPLKERVGTKAEYKQLGKDIQTRKQIIAYAKAARAAQKERAANPRPTLTKATPAKAETPMAKKKTTPAAKAQTSGTVKVTDRRSPKEKQLSKKAALREVKKSTPKGATSITDSPKSSKAKSKPAPKTVASKFQTLEQARANAPKPKGAEPKKLQTLAEARANAPKPKTLEAKKMQTLAEARANAPKPKLGPAAPAKVEAKAAETAKPKGKIGSKVASTKAKAASTKTAKAVKVAANTPTGKQVKGVAKKIGSNKLVKGAGKLVKVGAAIQLGREIAQVGSGQAEKDFRRIQALENRIAAAKGQKPKYTKVGSNRNLLENAKVGFSNIANVATLGSVGQSRKGRLAEVRALALKAEAKKGLKKSSNNKPKSKSNATITTPGGQIVGGKKSTTTTMGNKYTVKKGDTLSGIASRSGVSLKELRAANPKFETQAKYKKGNMIFSGTTVAIPKKKVK